MIRTILLGGVMAALVIVMWLVLPGIYDGASSVPDASTGQVWPLNNHGNEVYVTQREKIIQSVVTPTLFILALVGGAMHFFFKGRDHRHREDE